MEMILKFKLPEEQIDAERAFRSTDIALVLYDLDTWLRDHLKYDNKGLDDETLEKTREHLHALMEQYNIDFDTILE